MSALPRPPAATVTAPVTAIAGRAARLALVTAALWVLAGAESPGALGATSAPPPPADVPTEEITRSVRPLDAAGSVLTIDPADSVLPLVTEERSGDRVTVTISADVLFAFDSDDLTEAARTEIATLAGRVGPATRTVTVLGHTDSLGTPAYNVILSQRRANAVAGLLRPAVPSGTRVSATGRGGADPVAPNTRPDGSDDAAGRALNRRVQIGFLAS